ncbi:RDD family protein [soil metagenome]
MRLGLPADGPGAIAGTGGRIGAFALDCFLAALVAGLFTAPELPQNWSLLSFFVLYVLGTTLAGQTLGMRLLGLRLAQTRPGARIGIVRAVVRTALIIVVIPAVIWDADGRGLHDRITDTAVVTA